METNTTPMELTPEQKQIRKEMLKKSWQKRKNTIQRVVLSPIEDVNELELAGG